MVPLSTRDELADHMIDLVAEGGIQALRVRAVADRAGVAIGTVQHHFGTKDEMVTAAFERVVSRVEERLGPALGTPQLRRLRVLLRELVPMDAPRLAEARVMTAFAAEASSHPGLAAIQRATLERLTQGVAACLATPGDRVRARDLQRARIVLAAVDGLALHAVSAPGLLDAAALRKAVDQLADLAVSDRS